MAVSSGGYAVTMEASTPWFEAVGSWRGLRGIELARPAGGARTWLLDSAQSRPSEARWALLGGWHFTRAATRFSR